ncbi:MAG: DUF3857 domain-containing protein [Bacteroidota bacterium]
MKNLKICILLLLGFAAQESKAQKLKFGKISKAELTQSSYELDSSAVAAVLYRHRSTRFNYSQGLGFELITHVHERIKIYKQEGFDYATVAEKLYKDGSDKESISGLKAYTYNWENGKIQKYKLTDEGKFKTELNDYWNEQKFTMPNVKEGSVVEYEYRINSPFYWSIDEIKLQYDIPIKYQEITVKSPEYFVFKPQMKGYLPINPKKGTESGKITFTDKQRSNASVLSGSPGGTTFRQSTVDFVTNVSDFVMQDVPALKEEPFVNSMDNYRSTIVYELQYTKFPNSPIKSYTTTWEEVIESIYDSGAFGGQLAQHRYFKDVLPQVLAGKNSEIEKAAAIFSFVQNHMNWNGMVGYYTEKGVKKAFEEQSGNVADINLMLTAMLTAAGLEAHPVLISTRDHGIPLFPTRKGFNYVATAVTLNGDQILLDASNKYAKPNVLPVHALNWYGKLIKKDKTYKTVSVVPSGVSQENLNAMVSMDEAGVITGKMRNTFTDHKAYEFRNKYGDVQEDSYLEKLESANPGMEIETYEVKNDKHVGKPVMETMAFALEGQVANVGDKLFFSPMLNHAMGENPFKLDERNHPVDFAYPWEKKCQISIDLPEGYQVEEVPENMKVSLPEDMGSFLYRTSFHGGKLQLVVDLKIKTAIISPTHYASLKEFYKMIVEKESEKVVLSKITGDGDTSATTGRR